MKLSIMLKIITPLSKLTNYSCFAKTELNLFDASAIKTERVSIKREKKENILKSEISDEM